MFSVSCADLHSSCWLILGLHAFQNNSLFKGWNDFTFKDFVLTDDKRYAAVIDCEHLGAGEALSYFFCVPVSVTLGGAEYVQPA